MLLGGEEGGLLAVEKRQLRAIGSADGVTLAFFGDDRSDIRHCQGIQQDRAGVLQGFSVGWCAAHKFSILMVYV